MSEKPGVGRPATESELQDMVAAADTGGRKLTGAAAHVLFWTAVTWSLFQLWYASPLPFVVGWVLNDTEARAIHLAFGLFLAFVAYPAFAHSRRDRVPLHEWVIALLGAASAAYIYVFYAQIATRPGQPTALDLALAGAGLVILLEATRRSLGPAICVVALVFVAYSFAGPWMPEVIQHKGVSPSKLLVHQWLTTEGVFGVALNVSTQFIFLFVLFGSLLEKAGAGNWMMQVSLALLGHLRGGPAKVAVVSSALNGVISGSSVSNVVSGGIFTIPLMKRTGFSGIKAGAVEAASSINGQIMPPVMGAAAFLMTEYVGIPYSQVVKHAALPAIVSYIALFYIVHLEAEKLNQAPLKRARELPWHLRLLRTALGTVGTVAVVCAIGYLVLGLRELLGPVGEVVMLLAGVALYVAMTAYAARYPDLALEDANAPITHLPETWATVRTGLHFLIPIYVLLWCLMVEELSPGLSAFWATVTTIAIVATQRPLIALFRRQAAWRAEIGRGIAETIDGMALGARNMIGIATATATAGIIVGTVTLTGIGQVMTELVETIAGNDVFIMLILVAVVSLILGMGIPTTANYILVATLMAPVVVELGGQAGLAIPLIAVHLFVFYFGIMADVTPPVGLASYAAAAISGEDPIKTGWQASIYSMRTALLPFLFVFNPQLLLIDVEGFWHLALVVLGTTLAMMLFCAGTMNQFLARSRLWESAVLLVVAFALMRPDWFMNRLYPPTIDAPPARIAVLAQAVPVDGRLVIDIEGVDEDGETVRKAISLRLGAAGEGQQRLGATGLRLIVSGESVTIATVRLGSAAKKAGIEQGWKVVAVKQPAERPSPFLFYIPALALLALVAALQLPRRRAAMAAAAA